jgi:ribonuclease P protein component
MPMQTLRRRQDFLAAAQGPSRASPGVVVQMRRREDGDPARVGYTVTRKLGGAVTRNRIRRRLREAVRTGAAGCFRRGHDYVIIGRAATAGRPFQKLVTDIIGALDYLHAGTDRQRASSIPKAQAAGQENS